MGFVSFWPKRIGDIDTLTLQVVVPSLHLVRDKGQGHGFGLVGFMQTVGNIHQREKRSWGCAYRASNAKIGDKLQTEGLSIKWVAASNQHNKKRDWFFVRKENEWASHTLRQE